MHLSSESYKKVSSSACALSIKPCPFFLLGPPVPPTWGPSHSNPLQCSGLLAQGVGQEDGFSSDEQACLTLFSSPHCWPAEHPSGTWKMWGPPSEGLGKADLVVCDGSQSTKDRRGGSGLREEAAQGPGGGSRGSRKREGLWKRKTAGSFILPAFSSCEKSNWVKWRFIQLFKSYARKERTLTKISSRLFWLRKSK